MPEKINIQANVQSNFKDADNSSLGEKSLKSLRSKFSESFMQIEKAI